MEYLFWIMTIPFLYFNYKIVISDVYQKIIPNRYLLLLICLLPFWYTGLYFTDLLLIHTHSISFIFISIQLLLSFCISFVLYSFGVWAAGDAKYILVLLLFIPHIGMFSFIGNLGIVVGLYLLLFFVYFYIGKCLIRKGYARELFTHIYTDLRDKFIIYTTNSGGERNWSYTIQSILKWFIVFLIIYISFRLLRTYLINDLLTPGEESGFFQYLFEYFSNTNRHYIIFSIIMTYFIILFGVFWLLKKFLTIPYQNARNLLAVKWKISSGTMDITLLLTLFSFLASFLIYEFIVDPEWISQKLYVIFTFSLIIYITIKILVYSYHLTFQISEVSFIKINSLTVGDIVDKNYLIQLFGKQESLGYKNNMKGILSPYPQKYFESIENPIDIATKEKIATCYNIVNNYHRGEKRDGYEKIDAIKILKTFAFGGYIFTAFILTLFLENYLFDSFIKLTIGIIEKLFS